ncbi:hypothetical protein BC832DRAFT_543446 [Gaertneriomyces semiglobifer]|nr:hypothetical protein BC832DRAFT_543446 [Gaertneriomyces semiglobifer]
MLTHRLMKSSLLSVCRRCPVFRRPVLLQPTLVQRGHYVTKSHFARDAVDVNKEVETISELFAAARDELEYAEEAKGTTYYNEDRQTAQKAVEDTLAAYVQLKARLSTDAERKDVERRIGLRMAELRAQLDALTEAEGDH